RPAGLARPDCRAVLVCHALVRANRSLARRQHVLVPVGATPDTPLAIHCSILACAGWHPRSITSPDVDGDRPLLALPHTLHRHELLRTLRISAFGRESIARRMGI